MAATLRCDGALSHRSAAMYWDLVPYRRGPIHVSVRAGHPRGEGLVVHRRRAFESAKRHGIRITTPVQTLVDIAPTMRRDPLEHAINEADKRHLVDPETLRGALDRLPRTPGVGVLREVLDYRTFTLTDSQLERLFLPIARLAGLSRPLTRHHRTPAQQAEDAVRDQTHVAAGFTVLRFTRAQVRYEPNRVQQILAAVASRCDTF